MTTPRSIRIVSIISLVSIGMWLLAVTVIDIFQENLITLFYPGNDFSEGTERIFLASTAVYIISAAVIAVCNILIINGKTTFVPLALSGSAALIGPVAADFAHRLQLVLAGNIQGADDIARIAALASFTSFASYILNIAFFCTIAASAVYGYAKKKGLYNDQLA